MTPSFSDGGKGVLSPLLDEHMLKNLWCRPGASFGFGVGNCAVLKNLDLVF